MFQTWKAHFMKLICVRYVTHPFGPHIWHILNWRKNPGMNRTIFLSFVCYLFRFFEFFFFAKKDNHFLWINLMYKINQFFANNFSFFLITHRLIFTYSKANLLVFLNTKFTYSSVIDNGVNIFLHWITKNMVSNSFGHSIVRHILKIKIDSLNFMTLECD